MASVAVRNCLGSMYGAVSLNLPRHVTRSVWDYDIRSGFNEKCDERICKNRRNIFEEMP